MIPHPSQAREEILQLREFNLQPAFATACALRENVEDQLCPIENFPREQIFEIATLCRRKLIVKNNGSDLADP